MKSPGSGSTSTDSRCNLVSRRIGNNHWILCTGSLGYPVQDGVRESTRSYFPTNSVGVVEVETGDQVQVYLPGQRTSYLVPAAETETLNVATTGKGFPNIICNRCFVLKPEDAFDVNQTDARGNKTRRPSCQQCRVDIDRRSMTASVRAAAAAGRPQPNTLWQCPICRKMGIVGVNVRVVIDHDHHAGRARGYLCDSCNTGLGRFMNGENLLQNAIAYIQDWENRR